MNAHARPSPQVVHNAAQRRFEIDLGGGEIARADYRMDGNVMRMVHTEVPPQHEGKGLAGAAVRAAVDYARAHGHNMTPACSYVRSYMKRHPETHELLPPGAAL
jgi:predicted GNAT family acetyltransferase